MSYINMCPEMHPVYTYTYTEFCKIWNAYLDGVQKIKIFLGNWKTVTQRGHVSDTYSWNIFILIFSVDNASFIFTINFGSI